MRRKFFTLFIVPFILIMGGTLAYSGWSGASISSFNQSAAVVSYSEGLSFMGTNANLTPLVIGNGTANTTVLFSTPAFEVSSSSGSAVGYANVYANISNMIPGDWVEFNVSLTNTGTATLYVGAPHFSNGNTTNALLSLGLLKPGSTLSYTVYLDLPYDLPASFSGSFQAVEVSVPLSALQ